MTDCISREDVLALLADEREVCADSKAELKYIRADIRAIPAPEVRPVVLCKDCIFYQHDEHGNWCFKDYENELRDDDFCSHGKRKEET